MRRACEEVRPAPGAFHFFSIFFSIFFFFSIIFIFQQRQDGVDLIGVDLFRFLLAGFGVIRRDSA